MAGEDAAAAGAAAVKKPLKEEEEEEDDDELDNVPLALSRSKKAGNASASKVKKEDDDDDEEDDLPISHSRAKKGNDKQKGTMNSNTKASKAKKEADSDDDDDFMPISHKKKVGAGASNAKASKVKKLKDEDLEDLKEDKKRKKRGGVNEGAIVPVKGDKVKKEKKVYELPGQKHDPPAERDPLRIFYESLYEQVPTSEMAAIWLMEWGLLPLDVARKVYEKKQGQKFKSPVKTIVSKRKPTSPTKKTPASSAMKSVWATKSAGKPTSQKKRKASSESEDDDDDDFVVPKVKTKRQKASS